MVMRYLELVAGLGGRQPARRGEDTHGVRQSAAQADRKRRHGGTQRMERVTDVARIPVFLVHGCALGRVPGRAAGATIEGRFAVDWLQIQRGETSNSIPGCASFDCVGVPGARRRGERV